jgi:uncharacterized membrane protein
MKSKNAAKENSKHTHLEVDVSPAGAEALELLHSVHLHIALSIVLHISVLIVLTVIQVITFLVFCAFSVSVCTFVVAIVEVGVVQFIVRDFPATSGSEFFCRAGVCHTEKTRR